MMLREGGWQCPKLEGCSSLHSIASLFSEVLGLVCKCQNVERVPRGLLRWADICQSVVSYSWEDKNMTAYKYHVLEACFLLSSLSIEGSRSTTPWMGRTGGDFLCCGSRNL